jgi:hypothetical protein
MKQLLKHCRWGNIQTGKIFAPLIKFKSGKIKNIEYLSILKKQLYMFFII